MNGSNHLGESDDRPPHLCPVCLRKLHHAVGFGIQARYERLRTFSQQAGFDDDCHEILLEAGGLQAPVADRPDRHGLQRTGLEDRISRDGVKAGQWNALPGPIVAGEGQRNAYWQ